MLNILTVVRSASVINSKLFLDINDNIIGDFTLMEMMYYGMGVLLNIHTFNISKYILT